jgi:sterol 14-demethylase
MVVQPLSPCRVRYIKRTDIKDATTETAQNKVQNSQPLAPSFEIHLDRDLCQGHATCMTEAPELFHVDEAGHVTLLQEHPSLDLLTKAQQAEKYCPSKALKIELN